MDVLNVKESRAPLLGGGQYGSLVGGIKAWNLLEFGVVAWVICKLGLVQHLERVSSELQQISHG